MFEILIALGLLAIVTLIFFELFESGIAASNKGEISAQTRENARVILDRLNAELEQARPVPTGCGNGLLEPPAVILPWPGGSAAESAGIGCTLGDGNCIGAGNASPLDISVQIPVVAGTAVKEQAAAGPSGFLIFSEIIPQSGGSAGIYVPPQPSYVSSPQNYVWVMYQVNPPNATPAALVRYTYSVGAGSTPSGLTGGCGSWARDNPYFVPANSRESQNGLSPSTAAALNSTKDRMWIMVSHGQPSSETAAQTGDSLDPQLFNLTDVVEEAPMGSSQFNSSPYVSATLSSQVNVQGAIPPNNYH